MPGKEGFSSATRLAVGGRSGEVNPPVVHVSTFLFDSLKEMQRVSVKPTDRSGQYYGRVGTVVTDLRGHFVITGWDPSELKSAITIR